MVRCFFTAFVAVLCVSGASAQDTVPSAITPSNNSGDLPYSTQVGSDTEHVELSNGNLIINIPFVSLPGRKMTFDFGIRYDASFWTPTQLSDFLVWNPEQRNWLTPATLGWTTNQPYLTYVSGTTLCQNITAPEQGPGGSNPLFSYQGGSYEKGFTLTDEQGSKHPTLINIQESGGCPMAEWNITNDTSPDINQSGWWIPGGLDFRKPSGNALTPAGVFSFIDSTNINAFFTDMAGEIDPRNNKQVLAPGSQDSIGRTPLTQTASGNTISYSIPDASGTSRTYAVALTSLANVQTAFNLPGWHEYNQPRQVVSSVTLPNEQSYVFGYDNGGPGGAMQYGEVTSLTLPNGARVDYTWAAVGAGLPRSVIQRKVTVGSTVSVWDFDYSRSPTSSSIVKVTSPADPLGIRAQTVYTYDLYQKIVSVDFLASVGGTVVKHLDLGYGGQPDPLFNDFAPQLTSITTTIPVSAGTNLVSRREFDYDRVAYWSDLRDCSSSQDAEVGCETAFANNGVTLNYANYTVEYTSLNNVTAIREFDWGTGAPGPLLRQTVRRYVYQDNSSYFSDFIHPVPGTTTGPGYRNVGNRVSLETIYDGAAICSGTGSVDENGAFHSPPTCLANKMAVTKVAYDNGNPGSYGYYGEPTTISHWLNSSSSYLDTNYQYDSYGNIRQMTDPRGNVTIVDYSDKWLVGASACLPTQTGFAYPTTITNALNQQTKLTYYPCAGLKQAVQDPNDLANGRAGTTYQYDLMNRLTDVFAPDGGHTQTIYNDSAHTIESKVFLTGTGFVDKLSLLDGLGRTTQTQLTSAPAVSDIIDTTYDANGRVYSVTNPYRNPPGPDDPPKGTTYYLYDSLGRKTKQTNADNTNLSWLYTGNVTTATDENLNSWTRTTDALGRLTGVGEPNGSSTGYVYDTLGNLTTINQPGLTGETSRPTRSFGYDSLSRLSSATNPETGTVTYQYTANGLLCAGDVSLPCSKTDARGVTINYGYEPLNRLISKTYSGVGSASAIAAATQSSCYRYDAGSSGATGGNFIGRLTFEWTQFGSCPSTIPATGYKTMRSMLAYDAMGRVKMQQQCNLGACTTGQPYTVNPSYDLAGNLATYDNGLGTLTITNSYDIANRLFQVTSSINNATHPQSLYYVSDFAPFGAPHSSLLGGNLSITQTYDLRLRSTGLSAVKQ
jgi:YD repeat-containing protein